MDSLLQTIQTIIVPSIAGGLWLFFCVRGCKNAWKGRGYKYGIKILVAYLQIPMFVILAAYWVLITVSLMPPFIQHLDSIYPSTSFIYKTLPMAYATIVILVIVVVTQLAFKPLWKLTDEEKEYESIRKQNPKLIRRFWQITT